MKQTKTITNAIYIIGFIFFLVGCKPDDYTNIGSMERKPVIEPDYAGVTIPPNIAPMNFYILEGGTSYLVRAKSQNGILLSVKSSDGIIRFPIDDWKEILKDSEGGKIEIEVISRKNDNVAKKFDSFYMNVANEPADPYICYRLLYPGYKSWVKMKIVQRSIEDFREYSLFENQLLEENCVNCHSFNQNNPEKFLLHVRGSKGGTYFFDGKEVIRKNLRTSNMPANAVYPSWHPGGSLVAFSSNKTVQTFHMRPEKNIEVFDQYSSLFIYDLEKNEMLACPEKDTTKYMETFPFWSPDGEYLYYCRTEQVNPETDYRQVKYNLVRKSFDQKEKTFGKTEMVFNAQEINKSVSFPTVSPDGQSLVFTLHEYGTFSIWHKEADLYLLNLQDGKTIKLSLNSNETESYHSWSLNSKWLVFSSKRGDGLTARPYLAYFGDTENIVKPFVLPQKDPTLYKRMEKTFNRPEFIAGKIKIGPRDFARASKKDAVKTR